MDPFAVNRQVARRRYPLGAAVETAATALLPIGPAGGLATPRPCAPVPTGHLRPQPPSTRPERSRQLVWARNPSVTWCFRGPSSVLYVPSRIGVHRSGRRPTLATLPLIHACSMTCYSNIMHAASARNGERPGACPPLISRRLYVLLPVGGPCTCCGR